MNLDNTPKCTAHHTDGSGQRCQAPALRGAEVCHKHGGAAPAVRRKAAIRALVTDWRVDLPEVDPADQFRRLIAVTAMKQAQLEWLIRAVAVDDPDGPGDSDGPEDWRRLVDLYVGYRVSESGSTEEYLRVLVREERAERELAAKLCAQAISAGLDERRVRLMEEQAKMLVAVLDRFADGLGLTPEQVELVPAVAERVLREVPVQPTLIEGA